MQNFKDKPLKTISFNTSAPMSSHSGVHPVSRPPGATNKVGPGSYDIKKYTCAYKKEMPAGEAWTRKLEMEEFSKFRGFKNIALVKFNEYEKTLRAPGMYDVKDINAEKTRSSVHDNTSFGLEERFKTFKDDQLPPGTHSPNIMKSSCKQFLTNVPPFEWDGFRDRFKQFDPNFRLPPNLYIKALRGTNTSDIVDRKASHSGRGAIDLSSTKRDASSIRNHFAVPAFRSPDIYFIPPGDIDDLLYSAAHKTTGKFLKAPRCPKKACIRNMITDLATCYKDPDHPGPANYDLSAYKGIKKKNKAKYLFDSSVMYPRGKPSTEIKPGPGRYFIKQQQCRKSKNTSWVFKTKYERTQINSLPKENEYTYLY